MEAVPNFPITTFEVTNTKPKAFFDVLTLPSGEILASDRANMTLYAGGGTPGYKDGPVMEALFNWPTSLELLSDGTLVIADQGNHRIRAISPDRKTVRTLAGAGLGYLDGPCASAKFNYCISLCVTDDDLIYVSDHMNHRIRLINNGMVSTIAGNGSLGYVNDYDSMLNCSFNSPAGIKLDLEGNLLVADGGNHCIRKINLTSGEVSTVAGVACTSGYMNGVVSSDNPDVVAKFSKPLLAITDGVGNIYVSDYNNSRIRRIDTAGTVTTISNGVNVALNDEANAVTLLSNPYNITIDNDGNIIVADWGNNRLKQIETKCEGLNYNLQRYALHFRKIPETSFQEDMMKMLSNAKDFHSDFTFIVEEETIQVHRSIISTRSQYFNKVLHSGMKEVTESTYVVKEASVAAFREVLKYIYTDSLDFSPEVICDVMLLADRFVIPRLLAYCEDHIRSTINNSNAVQWFIWSDEHNVEWLKELTKKRIVNNFASIREHHRGTLASMASKRPDLMIEFFES